MISKVGDCTALQLVVLLIPPHAAWQISRYAAGLVKVARLLDKNRSSESRIEERDLDMTTLDSAASVLYECRSEFMQRTLS